MNLPLTFKRWSATFGKFVPAYEGKEQPPWAEHQFSFAFTGQPPTEVYEDYMMQDLLNVPVDPDDPKNTAPGKPPEQDGDK